MSNTKSHLGFRIGDKVRVKSGVADPDFPDIPMGGWAGVILEIEQDIPRTYFIKLNANTLNNLHPIYRHRCERDSLDIDQLWMSEDDLEPDSGPTQEIEQPTHIITRPLSLTDQDDRIRQVFGLTSDDPLPEADDEALQSYYEYLAANLSFPFEMRSSINARRSAAKALKITILGLVDQDDNSEGDEYGLFCQAQRDGEHVELPLAEVEVQPGNPNHQLVDDYSYWFVNWQQ